ncbi:hypothetical protein [Alicyclobacillus sp. ALC3]|uniref:hypothetical protein n=1 Tax=Alicyclobacillus sp. ALC3 TaxID=2796143 RepID=UPI0023789E1C|nr:hypothetical protein [Alicyclobacillus sp. ALC3]WDL95130.1 hypothetical protein JC200_11895 [Alicyclobacillus sp. ALC3]
MRRPKRPYRQFGAEVGANRRDRPLRTARMALSGSYRQFGAKVVANHRDRPLRTARMALSGSYRQFGAKVGLNSANMALFDPCRAG